MDMQQTGKNLLTLAIVLVLGLLVGYFYSRNRIPDPITNTEYVTDTIWEDKPYEVPIILEVIAKPKSIIKWKTDTVWKDKKLTYNEDSLELIITSLEGKIKINP